LAKSERPLSPHLQVYRPMYTMVLSISHRATGIALTAGILLLTWWLVAIASGAEAYAEAASLLATWPFRLLLAGFALAFWYHFFAGLRHLAWDAGYGFEKREARRSGTLVVVLALVTTLATVAVLFGGGGA